MLGLDFEIPKSDLIHFIARNQKPSPAKLIIHHPDGDEYTIQPTHVVRWLGFYLDQKLSFDDHVRYMTNKAKAVLAGLRLLANTVRGVTVKHARMLYKACVVPILTYGSILWVFGSRRMSLTKSLDTAQNVGLRWLLGAFKSTPIPALEHLASIPPIHIHLQKLHSRAAAKLRSIPHNAELARRLPASWDTHDPSVPVHTRPNVAYLASPIIKLASLSHPDSEYRVPYAKTPWIPDNPFPSRLTLTQPQPGASKAARVEIAKNANRLIGALAHEGTLIGFTDGSKTIADDITKVGLGYSIIWKGSEVSSFSGGIGPRADIYDAEMLALAVCARKCVRFARTHHIAKIHIFTDNSAAVQSINDPSSHPSQHASFTFRKHVHEFLQENPNRSFVVQWIPGHSGIKGNERADHLANLGRDKDPRPVFDRTATWARSHATTTAAMEWRRRWDAASHSHNVRVHIPRPPSLTLHPVFAKDPPVRQLSSRLVQMFTGHGFYGEYQVKMKTGRNHSCKCGEEIETIAHLLYHCPLLEGCRQILTKVAPDLSPQTLFGSVKGLAAVTRFVADSSIGFVT